VSEITGSRWKIVSAKKSRPNRLNAASGKAQEGGRVKEEPGKRHGGENLSLGRASYRGRAALPSYKKPK